MRGQVLLGLAAGLIVAAPAAGASKQAPATAAAHFQATARLSDDPLDVTATISTEFGQEERPKLGASERRSNFIRAFIDKKTGQATFQVYQRVIYDGDWRHYARANFETPAGPQAADLISINKDVVHCSAYGRTCTLVESFGFFVDEAVLRQVVEGHASGQGLWRFKVAGRTSTDLQESLPVAELAGLLQAVDAYRKTKGLGPAAA